MTETTPSYQIPPAAVDPDSPTTAYYSHVAPTYGENYGDPEGGYPANRIRWEIVRDRLKALGVKTVLEAGCGEGTPLAKVRDMGIECWGFDAVPAMVEQAKKEWGERVWLDDITEPPYAWGAYSNYDAVIALGPFPHLTNEQQKQALLNCAVATKQGGRVFVELRNELFAAFTLNRHTALLLGSLVAAAAPIKALDDMYGRLNLAAPPLPVEGDTADYNTSYSRFNNPLAVPELFAKAGLRVATIHPYHAHAWPPMYEHLDPEGFRRESLLLEWPNSNYATPQNLLRCSAFVVEAVKD